MSYLLRTLSIIREQYAKIGRGNVSKIKKLIDDIDKMSSPIVGVFGVQKRGKSTLINRLIGGDLNLLPVKNTVASSVAIMVKHDGSMKEKVFHVLVRFENNKEELHTRKSLEETKQLIISYGSHQGDAHQEVESIEIEGNFSQSDLLTSNCILLDTPGAENCIEPIGSEGAGENQSSNERDKKRALQMLKKARVVIFLESVEYFGSNNSMQFYKKDVRVLPHLFAINKYDKLVKAAEKSGEDVSMFKANTKKALFQKWHCHKMDDVHFISSKKKTDCDGVGVLQKAIMQHIQSVCVYDLLSRFMLILKDFGDGYELELRPARLQFSNFCESYMDFTKEKSLDSERMEDLKKIIEQMKAMFSV